ncbi:hypothetical protein ASPWEDRAFT_45397 [Aspergillus wentii DTO 134E9]|uniref:Uncharacterized protein n=1 Tax=Aspergillus wentii DTO 134E9 TaxID=1073089 RepID=A0A1L9R9D6_ASPWE|nr:uncharacterized protein ASPWEDRAFT_45397 [Aspergillus wentii DTO 134E9]OJJ31467.1 hypothetical protein ASPWEDRAFT_45397 [Aspergillus wentii DTO 134E9]
MKDQSPLGLFLHAYFMLSYPTTICYIEYISSGFENRRALKLAVSRLPRCKKTKLAHQASCEIER